MKYLKNVERELNKVVAEKLKHNSIANNSISKQEATDAFLMIGKLTGKSPVEFARKRIPMDIKQLLLEKNEGVIVYNRVEGLHPKLSKMLIDESSDEPLPFTISALKWWLICTLLLKKRGHRP